MTCLVADILELKLSETETHGSIVPRQPVTNCEYVGMREEKADSRRAHTFVVGLPRTGTKLIVDILHQSPDGQFRLSPENFYLGHFIRRGVRHQLSGFGDLQSNANVEILIDAMFSGRFRGTYWERLGTGDLGISRERLSRLVLSSDRSQRSIYEAMMIAYPDISTETIVGDKNPGHLYHVPKLLEWFPQAKIIHMLRDPRAILVSEWRKRAAQGTTGSFWREPHTVAIVLHVTITWLHAVRLHAKYARDYPQNYFLLKFENLVSDSEKSVRELCAFLDISLDLESVLPRQYDSSLAQGVSRSGGFDAGTLTRWKDHIRPWMNEWVLFFGKEQMSRFGYF